MQKLVAILFITGLFIFQSQGVFADDEMTVKELMEEIKILKKRITELEKKCEMQDKTIEENQAKWEDASKRFEHIDDHILHREEEAGYVLGEGFRIGAGATIITQAAINPNTEPRDDDEIADATYTIDIEIEKTVGEEGLAFMHLEAGNGGGFDGDEITTFSTVNAKAGDTNNRVEVTEAWYEHYFFDGLLVLTGGHLKPDNYIDQNEIANDDATQFISGAFKNSTAIELPGSTYGFRATIIPAEWSEISAGVFDDDEDWETVFEDNFLFAQVNLKPAFLGEDRPGNYRTYVWHDSSGHSRWGRPADTDPNFGFGFSADQKVLDYLTLFCRVGWEDPDVSTVEWAWSTGLQLDGIPWEREEDYIGIAIGMDVPAGEYENADTGNHGDPEGHFEAYYNAKINDHLHISPHYQLIWNPNGQDDDQPINIISLRGQIDF